MGLIFIPCYIRYLGMEAYGLIGLFAIMQAWLRIFDMGMTPTLNREMARYTAGVHSPQSIHDILHSLEILCFCLAILINITGWTSSEYLANHWLKSERLSATVVSRVISVMVLVASLRFIEGIYRGSLFGLQRQIWYNGVNSALATLRHGGAVIVLIWVSSTVQAFFLWQAFVSILSVAVFAANVHRSLPKSPLQPKFSRESVIEVSHYASGMLGITFLALLLTQVDKILLSRLLSLENFGYYTLASTIAGVLYTVIGPVTQAIFPRMVEDITRGDQADLISVYHLGAQLVTILTAPALVLLAFFTRGVVFLWSGDAVLAGNIGAVLPALVLGTFLNGLMWMPYQSQLADGWTGLAVKTNLAAVIVLVPAIFWIVPRYGAVGAAWIWVALSAGHVLVAIHFMHQRLLRAEKWRWYFSDVLAPVTGAIGVALLAQQFVPFGYHDRLHWLVFLLITGFLALAASVLMADRIRSQILQAGNITRMLNRLRCWSCA